MYYLDNLKFGKKKKETMYNLKTKAMNDSFSGDFPLILIKRYDCVQGFPLRC